MTTSLSNFSLLVRKHPLVTMGVLGLGIVSVLAMRWISPMIILFGWIGGVIGGIAIIHPWIGLLLMTFALPFEYLGSVEVLGMTVRASQMLLGFTATGTLLIFLGKRQKFRLEHPTFFWLPILLLAGMASLAQSENLARGFLVWGFIAFTSLLLWIVPQIIRSTERVDLLIRILFWSAMIVSLFGLVQFLGDLVGLPEIGRAHV